MAQALNLGRTVPYILERERDLPDGEIPTTWLIRPLTWAVRARASNAMAQAETGTWSLICLCNGLSGWKDFRDPDGREVKFLSATDETSASMESIDRIRTEDGRELARAIFELASLSAEQKKRSALQPGSSSIDGPSIAAPATSEPVTRPASSSPPDPTESSGDPAVP